MQRYEVKLKGVAPLMMHRYNGQEIQKGRTSAEKKLNERESGRWKDSVYWSQTLKCVAIPAVMIEACFTNGAKAYKLGTRAKAVLFVEGDEVPLYCRGELITNLEENGQIELDGRGAVVMKRRVDRWRPIVREWSMTFNLAVLDEAALNAETLDKIADQAGRFNGLGDFRPRFGRFQAEVKPLN